MTERKSLVEPVPCSGKLRLWTLEVPAEKLVLATRDSNRDRAG
jgi:hypothetical protein